MAEENAAMSPTSRSRTSRSHLLASLRTAPTSALPKILAPPTLQFEATQNDQNLYPEYYAGLMATNQHLAQQSQHLQQQLLSITAAQQPIQSMVLNDGTGQQQQYYQSSTTPNNSFYNQQLRNGLQSVISPVSETPRLYTFYNAVTGHQSQLLNTELSHSSSLTTPSFRAQVTSPPENSLPTRTLNTSPPRMSPPKSTFSSHPLPTPSPNAFRRDHTKDLSSVTGNVMNAQDGPKSALTKSAGIPPSPMNLGPSASYQIPNQHSRPNYPPVSPADQNPLCNTLYVGNLPIDASEEELKAMFSKQRGYKRLCFRTKHNGPTCFVEFEDISFAKKALNELYGHLYIIVLRVASN